MLTRARRRLRSEAGFTLVELLVTMACGTVVLFGLGSIMIVTLHQTQRTFTTVDATRQARTAFATIENELHSACVGGGGPPIQGVTAGASESDDNHLVFVSYTGTSASPTPVWHDLSFNAIAKTLVDTTYNVIGTSSRWAPGTTVLSTQTLLTNAAPVNGTTPVFQYFAYSPEYTDAGGNAYWVIPDGNNAIPISGTTPTPAPLATPLSANDSSTVVEVLINLEVGASASSLTNTTLTGVGDAVSDTISLRLTTPPDYVSAGVPATGFGPCQ